MLCFLMDCLDENVLNLSIYILAGQEKQPYLCPIILNEFFMKRLFQLIVLCMLGLFNASFKHLGGKRQRKSTFRWGLEY